MTDLIVTVKEGRIKGKYGTDIKGSEFFSFWKVPYAKPPIGELRFKDPEPPEPWSDIRDCTEEGPPCYSYQMLPGPEGLQRVIMGSEDCLYLNVFTHKLNHTPGDTLKPVMVWIHGGAFTSGSSSGNLYGPEILITQDIVLVTINYRLGALGFLSIVEEAVGNAGLKDMVQALKWVNRNISNFGGDPNCVTIFGESAGGAAIHYLVLSPLTKGLIHRAIAQSGCALNTWSRAQANNGLKLAQNLGFTDQNERKVLQFLQNQPVDKIFAGQEQLGDTAKPYIVRYFGPTIESNRIDAFITKDPAEIIASGDYIHVPFIMGYVSQEGIFLPMLEDFRISITYEDFVPHFLGLRKGSDDYKEINGKISQFYFGSDTPDINNKEAQFTLATDNYFLRGIISSVKGHTRTSSQPVYLYKFTLETTLNVFKIMNKVTEPGVCHGDELNYLFKNAIIQEIIPGSDEDRAVQQLVKLWTNFAKYGKPTPFKDSLLNQIEWKPVEEDELNFLEIGSELKSGINPDMKRIQFWDEIFENIPGY